MAAASSSQQNVGDMGGECMDETPARLVWGPLPEPNTVTTALPFKVNLTAQNDDKELLHNYEGTMSVSAITPKVCLAEGFEGAKLGLWCAAHFVVLPPPLLPPCLLVTFSLS